MTSTYANVYSDELYQLLLRNTREARELNRNIRQINKSLLFLGYEDKELSERVIDNMEFARANMKANIYYQAVLEGVAISFPKTEEIIENGIVNGASAPDVQKILIAHGMGVLVIPEKEVPEFKKLLAEFYEGKNITVIYGFMKEQCWKNF